MVGSYPLSCQAPTHVEGELGCDNDTVLSCKGMGMSTVKNIILSGKTGKGNRRPNKWAKVLGPEGLSGSSFLFNMSRYSLWLQNISYLQ